MCASGNLSTLFWSWSLSLLTDCVLLDGVDGRDCFSLVSFSFNRARLLEDPSLTNEACLLSCRSGLGASRDLERLLSLLWVVALSRRRAVFAFAVMVNGGKAQSRLESSGDGGLRGPGIDPFPTLGHRGFDPEVALTGETIELCPLLAGVSSPWKAGGRTTWSLVLESVGNNNRN